MDFFVLIQGQWFCKAWSQLKDRESVDAVSVMEHGKIVARVDVQNQSFKYVRRRRNKNGEQDSDIMIIQAGDTVTFVHEGGKVHVRQGFLDEEPYSSIGD